MLTKGSWRNRRETPSNVLVFVSEVGEKRVPYWGGL